ncbi:MAG: carboxylating nicotinate-nucleotide diphosphorylase [Planctomycetes bacterium]|nr:carboxylating nicotinate-nucleotide diphosphorylase [Planctomycetota bacterium]
MLDVAAFAPFLARAVAEDVGAGDVTATTLVPADVRTVADLVAKADGVLAGLPLFLPTVRVLDPDAQVEPRAADGDRVVPGQVLATVRARARALLSTERTALNVLRRLSGIATLTARFVAAVAGLPVGVYDTRKTTPLWRDLEKYAVRCGGGRNHRLRLDDGAMLKENHLLAAYGTTGPAAIRDAVARLRAAVPAGLPVCVEVEDQAELEAVAGAGADVVMLDGFSLEALRRAVGWVRAQPPPRPALEATGTITLASVRAVAETGVDRVSVGALTHSAPALDLSLRHRPHDG